MTTADAATLRTAPLSFDLGAGDARCVITNASSARGTASATLYGYLDTGLQTITAFNIQPHVSVDTDTANLMFTTVGPCECTVPNATTWRCTVTWASEDTAIGTSTP